MSVMSNESMCIDRGIKFFRKTMTSFLSGKDLFQFIKVKLVLLINEIVIIAHTLSAVEVEQIFVYLCQWGLHGKKL